MNEFEIKQKLQDSLSNNLNDIIFRQTADDILYSINIRQISRKLAIPLYSLSISITANLITPAIQDYINQIITVEKDAGIVITNDDAKFLMQSALDTIGYKSKQESIDIVAIFDEEYKKKSLIE